MNPVGIDLLTTLPEVTGSSSPSPKGQGADKGEFLTQFLDMLFAESQSDVRSAEQLQFAFDGDQEIAHSTPVDKEALSKVIEEEERGHFLSAEIEPALFSKEAAPADDSGWLAPMTKQEVETGKGLEETLASQKDLLSSLEHRHSRVDSILNNAENESEKMPPQEGDKRNKSQFIESTDKLPSFQRQVSEPPGSGTSRETSVNTEPKLNEPVPEKHGPDVSIPEPKVQAKTVDASIVATELGNVRTGEVLSSSFGQDRLPVVSPSSVVEREGPSQDGSAARLEVRRAVADVVKSPVENYLGTAPDGQQSEARNHPGAGNETHEEQLLRRLAGSRHSGQIEHTRTVHPEPDPVARIQLNPDKSIHGFGKAANSEVDQFSEVLMSARPGADPLPGNEKVTLHEPLMAKELVQSQSVQDFDRIVDQIVKRMSLQQKGETFQLGVRLKPEFMGELRIETIMEADKTIRAVIHVEDHSVKALLEGKVASLVQRFDEVGIHVDKVEIQTLLTDAGSGNDSSKERQGLGQSANGKGSQVAHSGLREEVGDASEKEINDGHIHLFI